MFYHNYVRLCNENGKSPSAAAEEMGFQRSVVTRWSKGGTPRAATIQKVAAYFGVSSEALINAEKPAPTNGNELSQDLLIKRALLIDKLQHLELEELAAIDILVDTIMSKQK